MSDPVRAGRMYDRQELDLFLRRPLWATKRWRVRLVSLVTPIVWRDTALVAPSATRNDDV